MFVPSHPALHTKETWDRAASPPRTPERPGRGPLPRGGNGHARGPLRAAHAPASASGLRGRVLPARAVARTSPDSRPPSEGCPLTPPAKAATRQNPLKEIPGQAKRRQEGPGATAAALRLAPEPRRPAGRPTAARYLLPSPRRSRALLPRTATAARASSSASQWVSDAPGPSAKPGSPIAIAFIWPPRPTKRRPDWRDASGLPSNHRARRAPRRGASPSQRRPRDSAGPGQWRARARVEAGGRGPPVGAPLGSLFFC